MPELDFEFIILDRAANGTLPTHINDDETIVPRSRFAEMIRAGFLTGQIVKDAMTGAVIQIAHPAIEIRGRDRLKEIESQRAAKTFKGRARIALIFLGGIIAGRLIDILQWILDIARNSKAP